MTPLRIRTASAIVALGLALTACAEEPQKGPPTEQEIHARDSAMTSGTPGRHPYQCDDDRRLLIDFRDQGLTVELRWDAQASPVVLSAPTQGLQYVGDTATATFSGKRIRIEEPGKRAVLCQKATRL